MKQRYKYIIVLVITLLFFDECPKMYAQTSSKPGFKYGVEEQMSDNIGRMIKIVDYVVIAFLFIGVLVIVRDMVFENDIKRSIIAWFSVLIIYGAFRTILIKMYSISSI